MNPIVTAREKVLALVKKAEMTKHKTKTQMECEHDWHNFNERIVTTNDRFMGTANFTVRACIKCHTKRRIDYKVLK